MQTFLVLLACGRAGVFGGLVATDAARVDPDVTVTLSEVIPTVATVRWVTEESTTATVEYGPDTYYGLQTPPSEGRVHEVDVIGLRAGEDTHLRVVTDGFAGSDHVIHAERAPSEVPDVELISADAGAWGTQTLLAWSRVDAPAGGALILDDTGGVTWYHAEDHRFAFDAELAGDSVAILSWEAADLSSSHVRFVSLDGRRVEDVPAPGGHHALALPGIPGVRFAYISAEIREWEDEDVIGDRIVESLEDGSERLVWSAFDALEITRRAGWETGFYAEGADWTHANGLHYDPTTDTYVLSLYYLDAVFAIDRTTGATLWQLGGEDSDFEVDEGFSRQHAPELHGDTLYVFDNGVRGRASRVSQYELDTDGWLATHTWDWETPEGTMTGVLGDVDLLPDDSVLSAWGDAGQVNLAARDGTPLLRLDADPGTLVAKAQRLIDLYP